MGPDLFQNNFFHPTWQKPETWDLAYKSAEKGRFTWERLTLFFKRIIYALQTGVFVSNCRLLEYVAYQGKNELWTQEQIDEKLKLLGQCFTEGSPHLYRIEEVALSRLFLYKRTPDIPNNVLEKDLPAVIHFLEIQQRRRAREADSDLAKALRYTRIKKNDKDWSTTAKEEKELDLCSPQRLCENLLAVYEQVRAKKTLSSADLSLLQRCTSECNNTLSFFILLHMWTLCRSHTIRRNLLIRIRENVMKVHIKAVPELKRVMHKVLNSSQYDTILHNCFVQYRSQKTIVKGLEQYLREGLIKCQKDLKALRKGSDDECSHLVQNLLEKDLSLLRSVPLTIRKFGNKLSSSTHFDTKVEKTALKKVETVEKLLEKWIAYCEGGREDMVPMLFHATNPDSFASMEKEAIAVMNKCFRGAFISNVPERGYGSVAFGFPRDILDQARGIITRNDRERVWIGLNKPIVLDKSSKLYRDSCIKVIEEKLLKDLHLATFDQKVIQKAFRNRLKARLTTSYDTNSKQYLLAEHEIYDTNEKKGRQKLLFRTDLHFQGFLNQIIAEVARSFAHCYSYLSSIYSTAHAVAHCTRAMLPKEKYPPIPHYCCIITDDKEPEVRQTMYVSEDAAMESDQVALYMHQCKLVDVPLISFYQMELIRNYCNGFGPPSVPVYNLHRSLR